MLRIRVFAAAALAGMLAVACGGIDEGNKPEEFYIVPPQGSKGDTEYTTYLCLASRLALYVEFTDGQIADYARRASWTSSDPDVVQVSNGDIEVEGVVAEGEDPLYYVGGTLVPVAQGTARVTAEYLGEKSSITVRVAQTGPIVISPNNIRLVPGSTQTYELTTVIDGVSTNIAGSAVYSFAEPDDAVATVGTTSPVVTAVDVGGPLQLIANFPLCDRQVTTNVSVAQATGLSIEREEGFGEELVKDTTERLTVMADFGDGPEQDLTKQAIYHSSDTGIASFSAHNYIKANDTGTVTVYASYGAEDTDTTDDQVPVQPLVESPKLEVRGVAATLNSVSIGPRAPTVRSGTTLQFHATGSYDDGERTQEITRHVTWTVSDTGIASISNGVNDGAGLFVSRLREAGTVDVQAEQEDATEQQVDKTTVTLDPDAPAVE